MRAELADRSAARLTSATAIAVAAVAVAARAPGAIRDAFWQDEVASAHVIVKATPWGMLRQIARTEATPPLWYALGWIANQLGLSPEGYRTLSVLAGAALAGLTVLYARRLLPLWASALAGLVVALGWQPLMHGRELRAYELFCLLALVFALALEAAGRSAHGRSRFWLGASVAIGSLTNYFFLLTVVAGAAWLWTEPSLRAVRRRLTTAIALGLVPLLVWSPVLVHQYLGQRFTWIGPFTAKRVLNAPWLLFVRHLPSATLLHEALPALFLAALLLAGLLLGRESARGRLCALLLVVPFLLETLAWLLGARVFDTRNLIGIAPFAAVVLASLLARLPRPAALALAVAAATLLVLGAAQAERTPPTPYDRVADALVAEGWTQRAPIVLLGNFFSYRSPLEWYLPGRPALTLGLPHHGSCSAVFAVAQGRINRAQVGGSPLPGRQHLLQTVLVARLTTHVVPQGALWRRSVVLASVRGRQPCVQLVPEGRIVNELRRRRAA